MEGYTYMIDGPGFDQSGNYILSEYQKNNEILLLFDSVEMATKPVLYKILDTVQFHNLPDSDVIGFTYCFEGKKQNSSLIGLFSLTMNKKTPNYHIKKAWRINSAHKIEPYDTTGITYRSDMAECPD